VVEPRPPPLAEAIEFRILGPLQVLSEGRALELGGQTQRALLAMLLIEANRVVSSDRLIEALWEEEPPEAARNALHVYVSRFRKLLGKERLETMPPGYLLRVGAGELDLARFQRLQEEGRLHEALALWRGAPLADFAYQRFAQAEIARLEELRLACLEERIERDLARGRHGEVVGELEMIVRQHPLRERLRSQLMLALYRSGRQAEALEAYQATRLLLSEDLGLEPGEGLKSLQRAILSHEAWLDLPVAEAATAADAPPPEAAPSFAAGATIREVRKTVTVLFVAVTTSTDSGARLDPEAQRRVTSRAFAEIGAAVERHGGTVATLAGEAVTAIFGIPALHEDDALRAVRTAEEARERLAAIGKEVGSHWAARLHVRIRVSTGEVVAGGDSGVYATGEPLPAAARLGQASDAGEILLDGAAYRLVQDAVEVEPAEGAFRLLAVKAGYPVHKSRFDSPMVGRGRERRRLHDAYEQALEDRSCQLFTVLGAAGVGKSRLVQDFLGALSEQALVARGRCLPYGEGITYWPVMEAVKDAAGFDETDSHEESRRKLAALVEGEEEAEVFARRIAETIGLADGLGETLTGAEASFSAIRSFFEVVARRRPLVLIFDDIHWGEATFLDLVEHLAEWVRDAPMLLVCLARLELLEVRRGWGGGKLNATSILLEPLSTDESTALIDNLAGTALDRPARRRIVEAAEGNPLFVEEMLALAMEDGRAGGELAVPPTIQALLAARLDRLGGEERAVLEAASAEGKIFHEGSVAELVPEPLQSSVHERLMALVRKELIRPAQSADVPGERALHFRHQLIRDAAYESIPKEVRAGFHERHAAWLEGRAGERVVECEEILGYHLEQAYRYRGELGPIDESQVVLGRKAAERLGKASRRAFARSDAPAAINLISRAVALLPADDPSRVGLIPNFRLIQGTSGDLSWAEAALSEAVREGDLRLEMHALVQRAFLRLFRGPGITSAELVETAEAAIAVFAQLEDELGLARAWRLLGEAHYLARDGHASAGALEEAFGHATSADDELEQAEILSRLGLVLVFGATPVLGAIGRVKRLVEQASRNRANQALLLSTLAHLEAMAGEVVEARELDAQARHILADEFGKTYFFPFHSGAIELLAEDAAAAEERLRGADEILEEVGERSLRTSIAAILAQALYAQGRFEESDRYTRISEEMCRPNDIHAQITWRAVRSKILARHGQLEAAESLARGAVAFAEGSDFLYVHGDALIDLAEVLALADRGQEAAATVREALALYDRKGNVVSASRARALLEELEG
jgi:DNA-binding SARP family transcriptional activator